MLKFLSSRVKIKAVKSAKEKAGLMLEELGQSVGRTLYLEEIIDHNSYEDIPFYDYRRRYNGPGAVSRALAADSEPLNFSSFNLEYQVMVRFQIEEK